MSKETEAVEAAEKEKIKAALEQEYKAKYRAVKHIINVDDAGTEHHLWLRDPSRMAVGVYLAKVDENVTDACEVLFYDCAITQDNISDVAYFNQEKVFLGILGELQR